MSELLTADLIVLGLGPAGACAAAAAAKAGLRVLAVDRREAVGVPVQCAEFVPGPLYAQIDDLAASTRQLIGAMSTRVGTSPAHHTPDFRGAMIDRASFDRRLVEEARQSGARIILGAKATSIGPEGLRLVDGRVLDAKMLIGADGPRSLIGRAIGSINRDLVETRQITAPLHEPYDATDIFLSGDYRGGYAWLFPRGDLAHIGLGVVPAERSRLKPLLEQLHARLVAEGRIGRKIVALTGGAIPVGGMLAPVGETHGRTAILAGDAAGLTNPVTGAGIASAVLSGRMAGDAAAALYRGDERAGVNYAEELSDIFGASLDRAVMRRRELLSAYEDDAAPSQNAMRQGWIAFPEYWSQTTTSATHQDERRSA